MAAFRLLLACGILLVIPMSSDSLPEPGKLKMEFSSYDNYLGFSKALYKDATISVKGKCTPGKAKPMITISWKLKYTQCADLFVGLKEQSLESLWSTYRKYEISGEDTVQCDNHIQLTDRSSQKEYIPPNNNDTHAKTAHSLGKSDGVDEKDNKGERNDNKENLKSVSGQKGKGTGDNNRHQERTSNGDIEDRNSNNIEHQDNTSSQPQRTTAARKGRSAEIKDKRSEILNRAKRNEKNGGAQVPDTKKNKDLNQAGAQKKKFKSKDPMSSEKSNRIAVARRDGIYILIVTVKPAEPAEPGKKADQSFSLDLDVSMESKSGYLSATDWPLLPFYGIMSLVYLFYGIIWLIISACQWRDLLRIQFWIGGVIALGMLEKAVFYSEYNNINNTGLTTPSLVVFAEVISVAKRTLARMLVIIVSMGFGIVKPRLGKSLHRVMGVGALYFIIGIVEGCLRSLSLKADPSKEQLIAGIPLAVLDAAICWWIFMSLVQTTRTLRIRRNVIKLSLYRHFTNTLIFAVLASVAYMIWSIKTHKFAECIKDWSELWLDEAFWHFLFSIILLVIMVLWRPTANNQRYAFTPIVDFDDDDEDNVTLSEAFDGMKMRNTRTEVIVNGDSKKKAEDDLKWVEENIPSSAADTVLPSVLDSDEELMTTKFEMSKME